MECNVAVARMHHYLDDDLPREQKLELKIHLADCTACRKRFEKLQQAEAFTYEALAAHRAKEYTPETADELTRRIMTQLPKPRQRTAWSRWVRRHPALTVASAFVFIMLGSFFTMWNQETELIVRGQDLDQLVISGNMVTVPEGAQISGNLTIENGIVDVHGEVQGNLTVIDGSMQLASTAKIIGENREINQALDWLWYKVRRTVGDLTK